VTTDSDGSPLDPGHVLDAVAEAVLVVRAERVEWANRSARTWLRRDDLAGAELRSLFAADDAARFARLLEQRSAGWPVPVSFRFGFVDGEGHELQAELRISELPTGQLVVSARDVTDVTRAESLMGSLARLTTKRPLLQGPDALLESSAPVFDALGWTVAFTEMTPGGSITRRVLSTEGSPVGAYGKTVVGVELPLDRTPVLAEVLRTGKPLFLDNIPLLTTGPAAAAAELSRSMLEARVARSAWSPIHDGSRISHVLAVTGKDLTEHDFVAVQLFAAQLGASHRLLRLSTELVRKERLAAVGEMAAVLAHEVRSPIGVIFNALGLMRRTAEGPERERLMEMLTEEAERLKQLVHDLLDFAGPNVAALEPVDLVAVVRSAVEASRVDPAFLEKAPRLEVALEGARAPVLGSVILIRRAMVNLLQNAFQHVRPGGAVKVDVEDRGASARIRVFNEGPSISPEVAAKMFEPFFTTQARGTGLGLAIVRRVALELGGRVELEPTAGGATFALELAWTTSTSPDSAR